MNTNIICIHPILVLDCILSNLVLSIFFLNLQFWVIYTKERRMHVIFFFEVSDYWLEVWFYDVCLFLFPGSG